MQNIKITVIGDSGAGKTSLISGFLKQPAPDGCMQTLDNVSTSIEFEGQTYSLLICDTHGEKEYNRIRPLAYPLTDVFFVCFDISRRENLERVGTHWWHEASHLAHGTPILIVGCKSDLRNSENDSKCLSKKDVHSYLKEHIPYYKSYHKLGFYVCCLETSIYDYATITKCFEKGIRHPRTEHRYPRWYRERLWAKRAKQAKKNRIKQAHGEEDKSSETKSSIFDRIFKRLAIR